MAEGGQDLKFDFTFMKTLLETGIIGTLWPKFTNLIVDIHDGEFTWKKIYKTTSYSHTESQMLDDKEFKDKVEKKKVDIILTSNYSPCSECADKLKEFYEDNKSLIRKFTIRFSHPYRINEQENEDGLKDLDRAGITLEAMTEESWFDVLMTDKSWFDSMKNAKYSFEEIKNKKDWFDTMMELFYLDPGEVRKSDATTSRGLEKLLIEVLVEKMTEL